MPVKLTKVGKGTYRVSTPGGTKAKGTTKAKAEAQARLLRGLEAGTIKPSEVGKGKFAKKSKKKK